MASWIDNVVTAISDPVDYFSGTASTAANNQQLLSKMQSDLQTAQQQGDLVKAAAIQKNIDALNAQIAGQQFSITSGNAQLAAQAAAKGASNAASYVGNVTGGILTSFFSKIPWWVYGLLAIGALIYFGPAIREIAAVRKGE